MSDITDLKPCPFCGGAPKMRVRRASLDGTEFYSAVSCYCDGYSARAHQGARCNTQDESMAEATAAWNTRAENEALRADAERGRKLVDWLERYGLLQAKFCTPGIGTECGDWWVLHKPYMVDGNGCEGYGKTEIEAIDAALIAENKSQAAQIEALRAADCDGGTCGLGGYCAKCKKAGGKGRS